MKKLLKCLESCTKTIRKSSRKTSRKASRKVVKKASRKVAKKASRKTSRKTSRKVVKKASRKVVRKVQPRKGSRKVVRKGSRKISKKTTRKTYRMGKDEMTEKLDEYLQSTDFYDWDEDYIFRLVNEGANPKVNGIQDMNIMLELAIRNNDLTTFNNILKYVTGYTEFQNLMFAFPRLLITGTGEPFLIALIRHNNKDVNNRAFVSLLIYAVQEQPGAVETLLRYGIDPNRSLLGGTIQYPSSDTATAIGMAMSLPSTTPETLATLIKYGGNPFIEDEKGRLEWGTDNPDLSELRVGNALVSDALRTLRAAGREVQKHALVHKKSTGLAYLEALKSLYTKINTKFVSGGITTFAQARKDVNKINRLLRDGYEKDLISMISNIEV